MAALRLALLVCRKETAENQRLSGSLGSKGTPEHLPDLLSEKLVPFPLILLPYGGTTVAWV